ncbi:LAQU0S03e09890g1_1 [Lachancea quebecensis]|uniref:LAQU0S03e09890g1_1 n=1 Tax=Lachancea quebecensis TaxID=1654605 RepID=A0A0P1KP93_9SACH|nr:LAQU0S03e09890g1_1 [Lachancea quebecensis]
MNAKSPRKVRRALSGKNVNSKSDLRKRSASLSPKKLETARGVTENVVRQVKSIDGSEPFQFFEQSMEDQQAIIHAQSKQCCSGDDKDFTTEGKENRFLDNPDCGFTSRPIVVSKKRTPLSRLDADEYKSVLQVYDLRNYRDNEHQSESIIQVPEFSTPHRSGESGDAEPASSNATPLKSELRQSRERVGFSVLKVARKLKFEET